MLIEQKRHEKLNFDKKKLPKGTISLRAEYIRQSLTFKP